LKALADIYPTDEQFKSSFKTKQLKTTNSRNQKIVQFILKNLEQFISGNAVDLTSNKYNVEHILPQKLGEGWKEFEDTLHSQYLFRIGNMTLMEKKLNNGIANFEFVNKREVYLKSRLGLTNEVAAHHEEWTPETIDSRQIYLAKQAISIWSVKF